MPEAPMLSKMEATSSRKVRKDHARRDLSRRVLLLYK